MTAILQLFSLCAASLTLWAIIRWFTARSPLDNIPGPPPQSFWKGNMGQLMNRDGWAFHKHLAEAYGSVVKINGMFGDKQLFVFDPKALHHIVVKDQYVYERTPAQTESFGHVLGLGLFSTVGGHHRKQRKMLNPVFSTVHMRYMLPTFYGIAGKLRDGVASQVANSTAEVVVDMLHWMARAALEMIGQSGLGYSFDPLTGETRSPYVNVIKKLSPTMFRLNLPSQFFPFIVKFTSARFREFVMNLLPWKALHGLRDISHLLDVMAREVIKSKRDALERGDDAVLEQIGQGKDIMSILLKANMEASEEDRLPEEEVLSLVSTFIFAAMDTTSSALSRILHVLSEHPKEQEILRKEIISARQNGGDLSHDELVALPYLDAVCRETLRLYAPISILYRTTIKDIVLPLSKPIRGVDGKEMNEIPVPANTNVIIGIRASNRNPDIWGEDVLEFKPERWLSPLPDSVAEAHVPAVFSNIMTFIGGGRACIGFKFSLLEMKVVLSLLLESFSFSLTDKEITWNMAGQAWPSIKGSNNEQLPLRVSKV